MKKIIILFITLLMLLTMAGCTTVETVDDDNKNTSMFKQIESAGTWIVVYHKETKVMYAVSNGSYSYGEFTVLVDADGEPLLYEEK